MRYLIVGTLCIACVGCGDQLHPADHDASMSPDTSMSPDASISLDANVEDSPTDSRELDAFVPVAPAAPTALASLPVSPSRQSTAMIVGTAATGTTVVLYATGDCTGTPIATGSAAAFASPGFSIAVASNTTTSFSATATDGVLTSQCSAPFVYVEDEVPPPTPSVTGTNPHMWSNTITNPLVLGTAEPGVTVRIFGNDPLCGQGAFLASGIADAGGAFSIQVQLAPNTQFGLWATATDAAGNVSACGGYADYQYDNQAPNPPILEPRPLSPANNNRPVILAFTDDFQSILVQIYTDAACSGPVVASGTSFDYATIEVAVADNSTTMFYATATDGAGNVSACSSGIEYVEDSSLPSPTGSLICARRDGGSGATVVNEVAADGDSFLVSGGFTGPATLGEGDPAQTTLVASSGAFVARYHNDCSLAWASEVAGAGGATVAVDTSGIYLTGALTTSAVFAAGATNETSLTRVGQVDLYLAKFTSSGAFVWAVRAGGVNPAIDQVVPRSLVTTSDGDLVVVGTARGTVTFGTGSAAETLTGPKTYGFVARYRDDGVLLWTRQLGDGTSGGAPPQAIVAIAGGSVVVSGSMQGTVTFGTGEPGETVFTPGGIADVFVARFTKQGMLTWARHGDTTYGGSATGLSVTLDGTGVMVTGAFDLRIIFDADTATPTTVSETGRYEEILVARLSLADGRLVWARSAGGFLYDFGSDIAASTGDASTVVGLFGGPYGDAVYFGGGTSLYSRSGYDGFVARYRFDGSVAWASQVVTAGLYDGVHEVIDLPDDSSVVVWSGSDTRINPGASDEQTFTVVGGSDLYIARFAP